MLPTVLGDKYNISLGFIDEETEVESKQLILSFLTSKLLLFSR